MTIRNEEAELNASRPGYITTEVAKWRQKGSSYQNFEFSYECRIRQRTQPRQPVTGRYGENDLAATPTEVALDTQRQLAY